MKVDIVSYIEKGELNKCLFLVNIQAAKGLIRNGIQGFQSPTAMAYAGADRDQKRLHALTQLESYVESLPETRFAFCGDDDYAEASEDCLQLLTGYGIDFTLEADDDRRSHEAFIDLVAAAAQRS